jgi:hypothetical protein
MLFENASTVALRDMRGSVSVPLLDACDGFQQFGLWDFLSPAMSLRVAEHLTNGVVRPLES